MHVRLREERGAAAVIIALFMVVLLGAAAFSIDIGAIFSERGQLQNGADAAAVAVAQDCAAKNCGNSTTTAQKYANLNANDGAANVQAVTFPTASSVRVVVSTRDGKTGNSFLTLSFGKFLGVGQKRVNAGATANWGSPAAGPDPLSLAFAPCEFNLNGPIQVIGIAGSGVNSCSSTSPSGHSLPGGYSWLADPKNTCSADVSTSTAAVGGSTGVSISAACAAKLPTLLNQVVLLPLYSDASGTGSGALYTISGFAAFKLLGWNFVGSGGGAVNNNTFPGATCTGNCKGIIGQFITFVSVDRNFSIGNGTNYGATLVALSN
jgi:hypothetical protein